MHPHAQLAAEAAEAAGAQGGFWVMHEYLYNGPSRLDRDGLFQAAVALGLDTARFERELDNHTYAPRVEEDVASAQRSGAKVTPTFFIDGRRYDGPWDLESLLEAIEQPLGQRVRVLARDFAAWAASGGVALLIAAAVALVWANSPWAYAYHGLWETMLTIGFGDGAFALPLHAWVNDGLMALFFVVVGLEIKREIMVGELAERKRAALPVAAALGGMVAPAVIYVAFTAGGPGIAGWGVPMATDIAFTLGCWRCSVAALRWR